MKHSHSFIPYGRQWISKQDIESVVRVIKSDWITQGPMIEQFENAVAKYVQTPYALAVSSGTAALHLAYKAAGIKAGDEIITTPLTFAATANALVHLGAKPVFVDIDPDTLNINPSLIEKKINKQTKAITAVDFAGQPADYDAINSIAKKYKLTVIDDASHAIGSKYKNKWIGNIADLTTFSFHPVKTITTGEGGMILTKNKKFYERMKTLRHHGIIKKKQFPRWFYRIDEPGYNFRLTDFQSALGISQLARLTYFIKKRRDIVQQYNNAFKDIPQLILSIEKPSMYSAWHLYIIQLHLSMLKLQRDEIFNELYKRGIGVNVHYIPLHLQPFYQKTFGYKSGDFPKSEEYYKQTISLPLYPMMKKNDVNQVIKIVKHVIRLFSV